MLEFLSGDSADELLAGREEILLPAAVEIDERAAQTRMFRVAGIKGHAGEQGEFLGPHRRFIESVDEVARHAGVEIEIWLETEYRDAARHL
jgi:hypothetical protein